MAMDGMDQFLLNCSIRGVKMTAVRERMKGTENTRIHSMQ